MMPVSMRQLKILFRSSSVTLLKIHNGCKQRYSVNLSPQLHHPFGARRPPEWRETMRVGEGMGLALHNYCTGNAGTGVTGGLGLVVIGIPMND